MVASSIPVGISAVILLTAALNDVAFRTIPNWMPAALFLLGSWIGLLDDRLGTGLLACGLIFVGTGFCWRRSWLGGGDVKLLTACGLVVPPSLSVAMLLNVALAGGVLALLYLALGRLLSTPQVTCPSGLLRRIMWSERHRIHCGGPLPYGSAIAAGALAVLLKG